MLDAVLAATPPVLADLRTWRAATAAARCAHEGTVERALVGGALADRLGFAFAAGYSEALRRLVPALDGIGALCATEVDGNHPRAIRTRLEPAGDGYVVTGNKKWATAASEAAYLLVVASVGEDPATHHNRLKLVRVATSAPNLRMRSSAAPFVPEIEHAEIELDGVAVTADAILPGDGYTDYLKPFRTVEDLHVHAAVIGYLVTVARLRGFAPSTIEALLALACATRALGAADITARSTHLALAGLLELAAGSVADVERAWSARPDDEWQRWQRDRPLLQIASKARLARREAARAALA